MDKLIEQFEDSRDKALAALDSLKAAGLVDEYEALSRFVYDAEVTVWNQSATIRGEERRLERDVTGPDAVERQVKLIVSDAAGRKARANVINRKRKESRGGRKGGLWKKPAGQDMRDIALGVIRDWLKADPDLSQTAAAKRLAEDSKANFDFYGKQISLSTARNYYRKVKSEGP